MKFSEAQNEVITARGQNLLVSAAAGSGKTTVLVERVLKLMQEGIHIDEILVVTFTRAASADMRRKLFSRLSEGANQGIPGYDEELDRLAGASISTLHSFCMDVIRSHFEKADMDPGFTIPGDAQMEPLADAALSEALEAAYAGADPGMELLCAERTPEDVRDLCREMIAFFSACPYPGQWFELSLALMDGDGSLWADLLTQEARSDLQTALAMAKYARGLLSLPDAPAHLLPTADSDIALIEGCLSSDYDGLHALGDKLNFVTAARAKKGDSFDPEIKDTFDDLRKKYKDACASALKTVSLPREDSLADIREDRAAFCKLYEIVTDAIRRLDEVKRSRGVLTFNDLEKLTLKILSDPEARESVRRKYKQVFVDEYQDTSDIQDAIVDLICSGHNRFMVGDIKQSIYRFRHAEPSLFREKYRLYREGGDNRLIVLKQNFRSKRNIIDLTNRIFARVMHGGATEIDYDGDAMLNLGRTYTDGDAAPELCLIAEENTESPEEETGSETEENEELQELNTCEKEAVLVGRRIREMMQEDPTLTYRDFCVLSRTGKDVLPRMAAVLASLGIPAYAEGSGGYFDAIEVVTVLSALRLLTGHNHDIELLCVLRSPLIGMSSEMLAEMRVNTPEGQLWNAVENFRDRCEPADRFLRLMAAWKEMVGCVSLNRLIRRILDDTDFYYKMGALPGGTRRQGNLDLLCQLALKSELAGNSSLLTFLDTMSEMKARGDGESAHELGENDNVVRLMTSHKSKGLQFRIVFAVLLGRSLNRGNRDAALLYADKHLGGGMEHIDVALHTRRETLQTRAVKVSNRRKDRAEELRVLYVTLTRAEDRLILVGSLRDFDKYKAALPLLRDNPDCFGSMLDIVASAAVGCPGSEVLGGRTDPSLPEIRTRVVSAASLTAGEEDCAQREEALDALLASPLRDPELVQALQWQYPYKDCPGMPLKISVTGLKKETVGGNEIPKLKTAPRCLSGEEESVYTRRGTAVHTVLRMLDYAPFVRLSAGPAALAEVTRQMDLLRKNKILTDAQYALVNPAHIAAFALSDLGRRAAKAETVHREWSFSLRLPAPEYLKGVSADTVLYLQGCIDLCFIEDGKWILVDYKTERSEDDEKLLAEYGQQLHMYTKALDTLTHIPVSRAYIYLTAQGRTVDVPKEEENHG